MPETKILSTKTVFTSKYFKVNNVTIERTGKQFTKDIIERTPVVLILPYTTDNMIFMERQYRDALQRMSLELVAGQMDPGEDPLKAAQRELQEETGLIAKKWKKIAKWDQAVNMQTEVHVFFATDLEEGEPHLDEDEVIEVIKMPLTEVLEKIENNEMTAAFHIAAILLFDRLKREGKV